MRPAGYLALVEMLNLHAVPNWHQSLVASSGTHRLEVIGRSVREVYTSRYWPGDRVCDHLEFALKYDGTNLAILAAVFSAMDEGELCSFVHSKPTGKYARRLWFFHELLTGRRLPLEDIKTGNYVDALPSDEYYVVTPARRVRRQRVNDNLPGSASFCPLVRKTRNLQDFEAADLRQRCRDAVASFPADLLRRAVAYLYAKETRSSFEIEHVSLGSGRMERFASLLRGADKEDFLDKPRLLELHASIVEPRFRERDYRESQNYVGETVGLSRERVHFVPPRPQDMPELMAGLIQTHTAMEAGDIHPVIHAAASAYGFVFLHPFEDGNGRIHRFLIHNVLARRGYTPSGLVFPVSAVMLKDRTAYDNSLEAFSRPLMSQVEYELSGDGRMTVRNDTAVWYRYMDLTPQAEALFAFIRETIATELTEELRFLANYDQTKAAMQDIVDMPDRQIDLFIRLCLQNNGRLSSRKRTSRFHFLTDEEVEAMERALGEWYQE